MGGVTQPASAMRLFLLLAGALCLLLPAFSTLHAQPAAPGEPSTPLDAAARQAIVEGVLARLDADYVFPQTARAMADAVRAHRYDGISDARQLADTLTAHLRAVSHDKHLTVFYSARPLPEAAPDPASDPEMRQRMASQLRFMNYGIAEAKRLDGNVGYLKMTGFAPVDGPEARAAVAQAMGFLSRTDALVIDLRDNQGGEPEMVQLVSSYLFGPEPVHLNSLYWRKDDRTEEFWTLPVLDGPRYGPDRAVYVLTANQTFSAAEEFCYNLQQRGRAVVVGETTGGGAHPGGAVRVTEHVGVWVPMGRAINPVSGTNWEGTGVAPDVAAPAADALTVAHRQALETLLAGETHPGKRAALEAALAALEPAQNP